MDPRFLDGSKISGQEFSEILDLGFWIHGSKISGQEFSEILDLGSWIHGSKISGQEFSAILDLGSVNKLFRLENLKSKIPSLNLSK